MAEFRTERLGRQMQEMIGALVLEGRIKDPRVSPFVSITRVNVSRDLSYADVYVSNVRGTANIDQCAEGLQSAAGFIRSKLGASLHIRKIPQLRFRPDASVREGFDMIQRIEQLVEETDGEGSSETFD
ncbi:MAG: 30S ribosome-binding factor RbfA [Treponema sp.]|nr:30S ribosome-binding factor RbfA [Treponema sp.]